MDVERLFSRGRLLLGHIRNRLSEGSVREILSLSSWFRAKIIPDSVLIDAIKAKSTYRRRK